MGSGSRRDGGSSGMTMGSECRQVEWWKIDSGDEYIVENIVQHLLGAGLVIETLGLLTDYRWVERMNDGKNQAPFQKVMSELQLLKRCLM